MVEHNDREEPKVAEVDSGLVAFLQLLAFLQISADPRQILHERGSGNAPFGAGDMLRTAKRLGVKARSVNSTADKLPDMPLPAIAEGRDGSFFLIARAAESPAQAGVEPGVRALIQHAKAGEPELWTEEQLESRWTGRLVLMTTREALAGAKRPFDVTWFLPFLVKYRQPLIQVLIASLIIQIVGLISPIFFQLIIDKVLVHGTLSTLDVLAIGLTVIFVWETLLTSARQWLLSHTTSRVDAELGASLYRHMLNLPLGYFETRRVGDTIARVRELETIREFLTGPALGVGLDLLFTVVFLAVMYLYSPILTLIVALSLPLYMLITFLVVPPLRRRLDEKFNRGADSQSFLVESVGMVRTLKSMAVEPRMRTDWERKLAAYVGTGFSVARLAVWGSGAVQLISKLTTVLILYIGAKQVIGGHLTVGGLVAFNMLAGRVAMPILRLAQLAQDVQQVKISIDRLGDVLNAKAEPEHDPNRAALPAIKGRIQLERVRFRYNSDQPDVLKGIDLEISPGEMIGVVGPSGSGKSTFTTLIQRLHVPTQGRVLVDGVDLMLVDASWLRRQVGVVLQENELLNRSVRDNIALADPIASMERVIEAAQLAGAHEFILQLPHGYDSILEERGRNLSGGQRQRIAIARALINNPRILVLDEATSALDAESEEIIQTNLKSIAAGRTVIIVAHRLSAVRNADRIITIDNGLITEAGSHQELLTQNGRYADLYKRQNKT
ncbi:type I secretion system permease/ATPase [Sphingomonas sp. PP-CC-3G-468]|uniref:type I secretion system permease/ATPase n=1 Tax=Sphingomonas sp. PP-CC-3G-468 TaxID=2135656 RepID=UPI0010485FA3|nr:type I secretion system permease/ATPase [Sphingomonas sp. PP-CC-3G-468]TCM07469.1 HlyB family type I secretion system ABC transporter [Sphingomonas sp. PP-CC-3G-468]